MTTSTMLAQIYSLPAMLRDIWPTFDQGCSVLPWALVERCPELVEG
jgi:hypothetical protein